MGFKWHCPFCNENATIRDEQQRKTEYFRLTPSDRLFSVVTEFIDCPNPDCKNYTFGIALNRGSMISSGIPGTTAFYLKEIIGEWHLIPPSEAKAFPDYIPKPILDDYREACLIRDASPKASATLSRRCLQGAIRDFWGVVKGRLIDEIDGIKDKCDPLTWEAIDAVRKIGNIGAHMEKDVNLVIDVDPNEAGLLIGLIETLFNDWYVNKHQREEGLKKIVEIGKKKEGQQKAGKDS
jgi:hypothetical protein